MPRVSRQALRTAEGDDRESVPTLREPRYSQSLERGLAILACYTSEQPILGIADLADELSMSRSTTHRYVITLVALGYLEQCSSRKYRLGLRVADLGMSALNATGLRKQSRPHLEDLRRRSSYTASLAVLDGPEILYVDRARSFRRGQNKIDLELGIGSRLPAYCTSMGKLLIASLPDHEQKSLLASIKPAKHGPNTITSKKRLSKEFEDVRKDGISINNQELAAGLHSIAAPVRGDSGQVCAAVNLAAHVSMISLKDLVDLAPLLRIAADQISAGLGGHQDADTLTAS
jgi:IclR family transcriptional regulator, pca regulon regulatory protein